jgi:hypothetical protein
MATGELGARPPGERIADLRRQAAHTRSTGPWRQAAGILLGAVALLAG